MIIPETVIIPNQTIYKPVNQHTNHTISNYKLWQWFDVSVFWMFPSLLLQNSKFDSHFYATPVKFFLNTFPEKVTAKMHFNPLLVHAEFWAYRISQRFAETTHTLKSCMPSPWVESVWIDVSKAQTINIISPYHYWKALFNFLISLSQFSFLIKRFLG